MGEFGLAIRAGITFMQVNGHSVRNFGFSMNFLAKEMIANQLGNKGLIKVNTPDTNQSPQDSFWKCLNNLKLAVPHIQKCLICIQ